MNNVNEQTLHNIQNISDDDRNSNDKYYYEGYLNALYDAELLDEDRYGLLTNILLGINTEKINEKDESRFAKITEKTVNAVIKFYSEYSDENPNTDFMQCIKDSFSSRNIDQIKDCIADINDYIDVHFSELSSKEQHFAIETISNIYKFIDFCSSSYRLTDEQLLSTNLKGEICHHTENDVIVSKDMYFDYSKFCEDIDDALIKGLHISVNDYTPDATFANKRHAFVDNRNFVKGQTCKMNFYTICFDTKNNFSTVEKHDDLRLLEAISQFEKDRTKYASTVNVMLGVNYKDAPERTDGKRNICGSIDLLQRINGTTFLSKDYLNDDVLSKESIIIVNTINMLKEHFGEQIVIKDNDTKEKKSVIGSIKDIQTEKKPSPTDKYEATVSKPELDI